MLGILAHLVFSQPRVSPVEIQYGSIQTSYKSALEALHRANALGTCSVYDLVMLEHLVADLEAALRRLEAQRGTPGTGPHASPSEGYSWQ